MDLSTARSRDRGSPDALKRVIRSLAAGLIALITLGIIVALILIRSSDEAVDAVHEIVGAVADESTEVTNAYLDTAESAGRMAERSLAASSGELNDDVLENTLRNVVAANGSIDGAFVGLPSGDFLYVTEGVTTDADGFRIKRITEASSPDRQVTEQQTDMEFRVLAETELPDDLYDPRSRPWYVAALDGGRGWTEPYTFSSSGLPGITHFIAVTDRGGNTIGVVGVDVRLNQLATFLGERHPSDNGHALIIGDDGSVIAAGQPDGLPRQRLQQLAEVSNGLDPAATIDTEWRTDGDMWVAALARIGADNQWTLVVVAPERDFLTSIGSQTDRVRTLGPLVGLLVIIGVASAAVSAIRRIDRLHTHAITDPLTGLPNRTEVRDRLTEVLVEFPDDDIATIAIDLDDFGDINDTRGHLVGDRVLLEFTSRLVEALGNDGFVGRIGGDEFLAALHLRPGETDQERVEAIVNAAVQEPFDVDGTAIQIHVSCGFCLRKAGDEIGQLTLLRNADLALLTAKASQPNIVKFEPDMILPSVRDTNRHAELEAAVERGEFEIHFQPEVDISDGTTIGAEALLRWRQPDSTVLTADKFIDDLERLEVVDLLTPLLLESTAKLAEHIGASKFTVRVNLSAGQLRNPQTLDAIANAQRSGMANWCIEITERTIVETPPATLGQLERLVDQGVELALDDFGTGYSSFAELANLPITTIKIDRSFIAPLTLDTAKTSLASVIYDMADRLSLVVVAEGIETDEQRRSLTAIGCRHGQGYLFGKAVPLEEFMATAQFATEASAPASLTG